MIEGVAPASPPVGVLQPAALAPGGRDGAVEAITLRHIGPVGEATPALLVVQDPSEPQLFVERIRDAAIDYAGPTEIFPEGLYGTGLIMAMMLDGLTGRQIIEALIFGEYEFERAGGCYRRLLIERRTIPTECGVDATTDPMPSVLDEEALPEADPPPTDADVAVYTGVVPQQVLAHDESRVELRLSEDGTVSGSLILREQLDNYLASVDLGCGLIDDEEDCSDAVRTCPAVVDWSADLADLQFTGDRPYDGAIEGTIVVEITTTPSGCAEPKTETLELSLAGVVSPERTEVTAPFAFTLERRQPPS
jgi:hypothetical protein